MKKKEKVEKENKDILSSSVKSRAFCFNEITHQTRKQYCEETVIQRREKERNE